MMAHTVGTLHTALHPLLVLADHSHLAPHGQVHGYDDDQHGQVCLHTG